MIHTQVGRWMISSGRLLDRSSLRKEGSLILIHHAGHGDKPPSGELNLVGPTGKQIAVATLFHVFVNNPCLGD